MNGWFGLALVLSLANGHLLVRCLWPLRSAPAAHRLLRASLAIGLGLGLTTFTYFGWLLLGHGQGKGYLVADAGLLLFLAALSWRACRRSTEPVLPPTSPSGPVAWLVDGSFALVLALSLGSLAGSALSNPHGGWDAWAIWNLRARFLFRGGEHWANVFSPSLAWSHPDYPLLLPASIARLWSYGGTETHWAPVMVGFLFTYATVGLIVSGLWILRGRLQGMLAGIALLASMTFMNHGASQYADIPLSYFFLGATMLLCLAAADRTPTSGLGTWASAGTLAGLAAWTKNEGVLFLACLMSVQFALILFQGDRRAAWHRMGAVLGGLMVALPWLLLFKLALAPPNDLLSTPGATSPLVKLIDLARHRQILAAYLAQFQGFSQGAPTFLIALLVLIGAHRKRADLRPLWGPLLTLGLMIGGYYLVYVITPHDLAWHLSTSLDRLFIQLWPLVVLVTFIALDLSPIARKSAS